MHADQQSPASVRFHVAAARQALREAGIPEDEATLDARLIAQHVLGWDTARLLAEGTQTPPAGFSDRFETLLARRARREPMAYVLGVKEFWGLTFDVSPAVLVPRPETELIVEAALEQFPQQQAPILAADVGTGSGCLAVTIAVARPNARVLATDISGAALVVAGQNARRHGVADRVSLAECDLLALAPRGSRFDLIVSNPPYVPEGERATLPPEVRHEPAAALLGGADGLATIRRLVAASREGLEPGGRLIFEFACGQTEAVTELIRARGLRMIEVKRDLQGIPRTAIAVRD